MMLGAYRLNPCRVYEISEKLGREANLDGRDKFCVFFEEVPFGASGVWVTVVHRFLIMAHRLI